MPAKARLLGSSRMQLGGNEASESQQVDMLRNIPTLQKKAPVTKNPTPTTGWDLLTQQKRVGGGKTPRERRCGVKRC